jgi:putative membrane protein
MMFYTGGKLQFPMRVETTDPLFALALYLRSNSLGLIGRAGSWNCQAEQPAHRLNSIHNAAGFGRPSLRRESMRALKYGLLVCMIAFPAWAADDSAAKQAFAEKASTSNTFEIEAAKIEIAKGKATDARQFAQDMLKDHGKAAPLLVDAAKQDGVTVPTSLDADHQQKLEALKQSDAANLDQAYLSTQVTAHQQAYQLFQSYSKSGPDGQLKNTATKLLPDLHMHLTRVQGMANK